MGRDAMQIVVAEGGLAKEESEFNAEFTKHLLKKLDWAALAKTAAAVCSAAVATAVATLPPMLLRVPDLTPCVCACVCVQLGVATLPAEIPAGAADDETFLKSVHDLVLDVRVVAAASACTHQKKLMLDVRVVARRFTSRRASLYVLTASVSTRSPTASPTCCCMRTKSSRLQPTCRREQRQT